MKTIELTAGDTWLNVLAYVLAEHAGAPVKAEANLREDLGLDSHDAIEHYFDIKIPDSVTFKTVGCIVDYLTKLLGPAAPAAGSKQLHLEEDQWVKRYRPVMDGSNESYEQWEWRAHGDSLLKQAAADRKIWTAIDTEGCYIITNGSLMVNRMHNVVTEKPFESCDWFIEVYDKAYMEEEIERNVENMREESTADLDATQVWESPKAALDACLDQPCAMYHVWRIMSHNMESGEVQFCRELMDLVFNLADGYMDSRAEKFQLSLEDVGKLMGLERKPFQPGERVRWNDPDDDACSKDGVIHRITYDTDGGAEVVLMDGWESYVLVAELELITN